MVDVSAVLRTIGRALEILTAAGETKAIDYGRQAAGWSDFTGNDLEAAMDIQNALIGMPAHCNLAVMWKFAKDNPRLGEPYLNDLTTFAAHMISGADRNGRENLKYWVRHWARKDGHYTEAARLYGKSHMTQRRFYVELIELELDAWLTEAKGWIEEVMEQHEGLWLKAA
ncbi:hypothetical protein VI06_03415 [Aquitalea magnusonii]|nr:hypothetical protein VI06_03415 [Aquitalea magnusonii]